MDFGPSRDRFPTVQLSSAAMIRHRDEHTTLTFSLINGETLTGQVKWFDDTTFHIATNDGRAVTLHKAAVLYYQPV